jgi:hypothetical protein
LPPHQQALRRCFEAHPVVHFVYSFTLLFTVLSLFFWFGEQIGSSPLWHSIASAGTTAVIALVGTIIDFVAARWRWSRDRSVSAEDESVI